MEDNLPNNRKITIDDIAKDLGVSKTTISRAISGKGRISQETRDKVQAYIEKYNYRPNAIAKGLAKSRTYNIALVVPGDYALVDLPFFQKVMGGVCEYAASIDYDVLISLVEPNDLSQLKRLVDNHKVDGAILTRTLVNDPPMEFLKKFQVPFVTLGTTTDESVIQIDNNHMEACKELTGILLDRGIRKIALIGGNSSYVVTRKRLLGYETALREHHLKVDERMKFINIENSRDVAKVTDQVVKEKAECILCMDDSVCNNVLNQLRRKDVKIPDQIKVASFYHSSILENNIPEITSIRFDTRELGITACRILIDHIKGKEVPYTTFLGYEVALCKSTGE